VIEIILIAVLIIIAMLCRALVHVLINHFGEFLAKYKIKNLQWWYPKISWKNKYVLDEDGEVVYKNGKGVRNKKIVQLSDAFHFFNMIELGAYTFAITIPVWLYLNLVWWWFLVIFIIIGIVIILSFNLFYDKIWR